MTCYLPWSISRDFSKYAPMKHSYKPTENFNRASSNIETELCKQGKTPDDATLEEMDALWEAAKKKRISPKNRSVQTILKRE